MRELFFNYETNNDRKCKLSISFKMKSNTRWQPQWVKHTRSGVHFDFWRSFQPTYIYDEKLNCVYAPFFFFFGSNPNLGQPAILHLIIILPQILTHSSRERNSFTSLLMWVWICFSRCTTEEFFVSPIPLCSLLLFFPGLDSSQNSYICTSIGVRTLFPGPLPYSSYS